MNWENIIFYGLIGFIVILVMAFLNKAASQQPTRSGNGEYVLRIHILYIIIGCFAVAVGLSGILAFLIYQEPDMIYFAVALNLFFTPLGMVCILWYKNHIVIFNNTGIKATNWIGKTTTIEWSEINEIKYNSLSGQLVMTGSNKKIKAHQHLIGLSDFVTTLTEKTNVTTAGLKLPFKAKNHNK